MRSRLALDRLIVLGCAAIAAATVLLRLPFLGSIGPDEGGYAYIASQWARGHPLYRALWIDRPQGLLLVYRGLIALGNSVWAIRLGALLAAVSVGLLLVAIGRMLISDRAGLLAGALYAFVGLGPRIEGFTFNGELAAAVPSTAAVAAVVSARRRDSTRWFFAAGLLGACGVLMKQSGFDGLAVVLVVAAGARPRRNLAAAASGAALPLAASGIAGVLGGWSFYWSDLVASPLGAAPPDVRLRHLTESLPHAVPDLLPLALVAAAGAWALKGRPARRIALTWLVAAAVAINVGGLYWPHYYVQLVPPLALLGGAALARAPSWRALAAAALLAFPAVFYVGNVLASPDPRSDRLVKYATGFDNDARVADYVRRHTSPNEHVYAFVSRADFYFLAGRPAASPFLWAHPVKEVPGAATGIEQMLAGRRRPPIVVMFQQPHANAFGRRIRSILRRDYREIWRAPGTATPVFAARGERASAAAHS